MNQNAVIQNPNRPPKLWWDRMYEKVRQTYSKRTARHSRITSREKLSAITGNIWWRLEPEKRKSITEFYELKKINWKEMPAVSSPKTFLVAETPYGNFWVVYSDRAGKWLVTGSQTASGKTPVYDSFSTKQQGKKYLEKNIASIVGLKANPEETYHFGPDSLESLKRAIRMEWLRACNYDKIDPRSSFIAFSEDNPYMQPDSQYQKLVKIYMGLRNTGKNPKKNPFVESVIAGMAMGTGWTAGTLLANKLISRKKK